MTLGAAETRLQGMGTTLVLAVVSGVTAHLAHVGDSRAYLLRQDRLHRLTEDHSYATELVRGGLLDPMRASAHPLGHTITRAIGMPGDVQPDVRQITLAHGDRLLLCSDGLTKMLADERVEAILGGGDPGTACRALVDAANEAGGDDNVSVVAVDVSGSRL